MDEIECLLVSYHGNQLPHLDHAGTFQAPKVAAFYHLFTDTET
jgi:hypothetical protein